MEQVVTCMSFELIVAVEEGNVRSTRESDANVSRASRSTRILFSLCNCDLGIFSKSFCQVLVRPVRRTVVDDDNLYAA